MFPGPTLEANWGDTFQITVRNKITGPEEPTSLHWHGILQQGTPFMDGIPGVQQCPIAPGSSQTYTFQADLYGTSWYHSHLSAQYAAGLFGPMVIHGPTTKDCDKDLGPVILCDWSHSEYTDLVEKSVGKGESGAVESDVSLINGKTNANFNFTSGKTHRLRLVNTAAEATYVFSIDEHDFSVIAHDFVPVKPYTTKNITLGVGQRADIIVNGNGKKNGAYWMRSTATDCSLIANHFATAAIYYEGADHSKQPNSTSWGASTVCEFPVIGITQPALSLTPPPKPATTQIVNITFGTNSSGNPEWSINNSSFHANYNEPPLLLAHMGNTSYNPAEHWNVYNFGSNSSVRLVVYNTFMFSQHPMHLHGHNFWVIAQGYGEYDGHVTQPNNPERRDVVMLHQAQSATVPAYVVLEWQQDNPGVWPFHCHIAWHVSGGLYMNVMERPADIQKMKIPQSVTDTCVGYKAWQAAGNIVDQIDSGEKKRDFVRW